MSGAVLPSPTWITHPSGPRQGPPVEPWTIPTWMIASDRAPSFEGGAYRFLRISHPIEGRRRPKGPVGGCLAPQGTSAYPWRPPEVASTHRAVRPAGGLHGRALRLDVAAPPPARLCCSLRVGSTYVLYRCRGLLPVAARALGASTRIKRIKRRGPVLCGSARRSRPRSRQSRRPARGRARSARLAAAAQRSAPGA